MIFIPEGPTLVGALAQEYERVVGDEKGVKNSQPKGRNDRTWAARSETAATKVNVRVLHRSDLNGTTQRWLTPDFPQYPTTQVTYEQASNLCDSVGKRLCTSTRVGKGL